VLSLDISFYSLGYFILFPGIFHCHFHLDAWVLSIDISFLAPGFFIVLKIAKKKKKLHKNRNGV